jgi:1-deoxy-D-xylulose-5-phosphate synthase
MLYTAHSKAYEDNITVAVRYPRGAGVGAIVRDSFDLLPWGRALVVKEHTAKTIQNDQAATTPKVAVLAFGPILHYLQKTIETAHLNVLKEALIVDMRFIKPLDLMLMQRLCDEGFTHVITIEDSAIEGGAGSACLQALAQKKFKGQILNLGLPDVFIDQGDVAQLWAEHGLGPKNIIEKIEVFLATN